MSAASTRPSLRFTERRVAALNKCYCVASFHDVSAPQRTRFLIATEQDDACFLCDVDQGPVEKLWDGPGGVMSMVQLCEGDGRMVLATQAFYGPDTSAHARLVVAKAFNEVAGPKALDVCSWRRFVVAEMPFVHRFDVVPGRGANAAARYLVVCTLKTGQKEPGDWSQPGKVLVARLPADFHDLLPLDWGNAPEGTAIRAPLKWQTVVDGCLKNHGYSRHVDPATGSVECLLACDSGTMLLQPPSGETEDEGAEGTWSVVHLTTDPASDATLVDLNGDGLEELITVSPFHGDTLFIYHKDEWGAFHRVYTHPTPLPFLHAIWACTLGGRPVVVLGHRAGARDLLLLSHDSAVGYTVEVVAHDCGPANVMAFTFIDPNRDAVRECVVSCNRETDTATLYEVVQ